MNQTSEDKAAFNDEFTKLIAQLKLILKPNTINTVGLFKWELSTRSNGRVKKVYVVSNREAFSVADTRSSLSWFLNFTDEKVELIEDFSLGNLGGQVMLYVFKRKNNTLLKKSDKMLRRRVAMKGIS